MGLAIPELITLGSAVLGAGSTLFGGGKKKAYNGLSEQGNALQNTIYDYYSKQASQPTTYTPQNSGNLEAMNLLFNSYLGKPYTVQGLGQYGQGTSQGVSPQSMRQPSVGGMPGTLPTSTAMMGGGGSPGMTGGYYRPMA